MYLEPKFLYNFRQAAVSKPSDNFIVPFGKAKIRQQGSDVTVVAYGTAVHQSLRAAEEIHKEQNVSVEVIDLRSLVPWDRQTVLESVKKTNRVVIAHEDKIQGGFGGDIASYISDEGFKYLDAPVLRVGSKNTPVGFAKEYENAILLSHNDVKEAINKTIRY
jgi:2-oxoisovalerate dehydrogenase E1 component